MAIFASNLLATTIDRLVRGVVLPVTSVIPTLASRGILLAGFAALWLAFGAALVMSPGTLDKAWDSLGQLPLPVQGIAWLLFLPLMVGLWAWGTDWPVLVRLLIIAGIAGWNLLVFIPRRGLAHEAGAGT